MINVLMVSMLFPPDFGGASVQSIRLTNALKSKGVNVEFFSDNGCRQTVISDVYEDITVNRVKTYFDDVRSKVREGIFCIKLLVFVVFRPDLKILHFHSIRGLEALLFPFFRFIGRKVLLKLTLVDSDDPLTFKKRKNLSLFYMWGLKSAHVMVAISPELKERSISAGIEEDVVHEIFNGFDEQSFFVPNLDLRADLRQKLGIDAKAPVFLSIGKVEYRKGYDLLIESFVTIQREMPNAHLIIVGPDNNTGNQFYVDLCTKIAEKKLNNISFVGKKSNVHEYLKAADYFLFCSRQEGFGTVLIEAMACGLPTVAMNIAGITDEIVTDSRIGRICYSYKPEDFASLSLELIAASTVESLDLASQELKKTFSMSHISDKYIELYKSMLN
jgi:L-malate glycosyltransferase